MDNQVQSPIPAQPVVPAAKPKKPVYKKWWFWVLIVLAAVIVIPAATSGDKGPTEPATDANGQPIATTKAVAAAATNKVMQGVGKLGDFDVEIVNAQRQTTEYTKDELILITYRWTNNSPSATSFLVALDEKVYQDGIECTSTFAGDGETNKEYADIKPGATMELTLAYKLNNTTSPVEVEIGRLFSFSSAQVVKTFAIS